MISLNHIFVSNEALLHWLESTIVPQQKKSTLIQIFDSTLNKKQLVKITKIIKKYLPEAYIVGTSSCGVIYDGEVVDYVTNINISLFDFTLIKPFLSVVSDPYSVGKDMAETLVQNNTKCVLLFINTLSYNSDAFVNGFNDFGGEKVILAGGGAGDNFLFEEPFVIYDTKVYTNAVVGIALSGEELQCMSTFNYGWKGMGKYMRVSKVKDNCIYEINDTPVIDVYSKYLGENITKSVPASLIEFPLIFNIDGVEVARTVYKLSDDGGLCYLANILEGTEVRFGIGAENLILNKTADIYIQASFEPLEAIFIYTSASRKVFFDKHINSEYTALSTLAPQAGFISYGEFIRTSTTNKIMNVTTAVLGLSESEETDNTLRTNLLQPSYRSKSTDAITHLIDVTTQELNEQIKDKHNVINILQQYKYALDTATLVSKTDKKGIITYANENFCHLSGYTQGELIGQAHCIVRHPEMSTEVFQNMWEKISNKTIWRGMIQNKHKSGSSYYVHATIFPILDENGNIIEYMSLREDLTARIEYEKSLEIERKRLYKILDNQSSVVALTNRDGHVEYLNKKFFDYFDFKDMDDFLSQYDCICDLYVDAFGNKIGCGESCHIHEIIENENENENEQVHILDKYNKVLTFTISTKKTSLDEDNDDIYLSTLTNITDIEKARINAEDAMNAKASFLANMSHEIRTPLNGIIGFTDLLSESNLDEKQKTHLAIIKNSADMLLGVVNGILDFSKIESGKLELELIATNLFVEMQNIYMNYSIEAEKKSLSYQLIIDTSTYENLYIDRLHFQQTVSNLINNAIKFTAENGAIVIKTSVIRETSSYQMIKFSVKDNGVGISKDRQEKIFEAFLQEDNSTTREYGGTGLGLSISSSLINLMGANIELKSEKSVGSEFSFVLKLDKVTKNNTKLCELLNDSCVQVVRGYQYSDEVIRYLKSLSINTYPLVNVNQYHKDYRIIVLFNVEEAVSLYNTLDDDKYFIICLDKETKQSSLLQNLQIINFYKECSSQLYNVLYTHAQLHKSIVTNKDSFYGLRALVAEDNEVNQLLIEEFLKSFGISIELVDNGKEALLFAEQKKFDIIFMDINMPIMNGKEAAKLILNNSLNKTTPIVAMTSNVLDDDIEEYKKIGMKEHLGKPFHANDIFNILLKIFTKNFKDIQNIEPRNATKKESVKESLDKASKLLELPDIIMQKLLDKFLLTLQSVIEDLDKANKKKDYESLALQAHNLKGASSSMCFDTITKLTEDIENELKSSSEMDYSSYIDALREELDILLKYISLME